MGQRGSYDHGSIQPVPSLPVAQIKVVGVQKNLGKVVEFWGQFLDVCKHTRLRRQKGPSREAHPLHVRTYARLLPFPKRGESNKHAKNCSTSPTGNRDGRRALPCFGQRREEAVGVVQLPPLQLHVRCRKWLYAYHVVHHCGCGAVVCCVMERRRWVLRVWLEPVDVALAVFGCAGIILGAHRLGEVAEGLRA